MSGPNTALLRSARETSERLRRRPPTHLGSRRADPAVSFEFFPPATRLVDQGVTEFHFYTLNRAELTLALCHMLGIRRSPPPDAPSDEECA